MALEIRTFPGAGGGTDLSSPVHMLADSKARWIIDGLVDRAGLVRQRGKLKATQVHPVQAPFGLMATFQPGGELVLAMHTSDQFSTSGFRFLSKDYANLGDFGYTYSPPVPRFFLWSPTIARPGVLFYATSRLDGFDTEAERLSGLWRGGTKANYTTGTISATQGTKTVTGTGTTWSTNLGPGMFLFWDRGSSNYTLLGVINTVDSNTQVTLEDGALFTSGAGQNYKATSMRQIRPRIGVGRVSGAVGQAVVNGTGTKFRQIGTGSTWAMFRQRDMAFLGNVSTIQSDTQLTLAANIPANNEVNNDKYIAIKIQDKDDIQNAGHGLGNITANWQGRQFFAAFAKSTVDADLVTRLWYSDTDDFEVVDMTKDGWSLDIPSSEGSNKPIVGLCSTQSGLLIFKETEVYILSGSADPSSWSVRKLTDNGTTAPQAIVNYQGGAIWPGDRGIFFYDGMTVENITADSLGDWWTKSFSDLKPGAIGYNMVAFCDRDHYFLYSEYVAVPDTASYYKGAVEQDFTGGIGFIINIPTKALSFSTNLPFRGAVYISSLGSQKGGTRFVVEADVDGSSYIANSWHLFIDEGSSSIAGGQDDFACKSNIIGPSFYFESARYDMDDPQLKKLIKQVQLYYRSDADLTVDVVLNFDVTGTTLSSVFPASATFVNKRIKFLKRAQLLGFRIYVAGAGGSVPAEVQLGPWAIGFKRQRPGRV